MIIIYDIFLNINEHILYYFHYIYIFNMLSFPNIIIDYKPTSIYIYYKYSYKYKILLQI